MLSVSEAKKDAELPPREEVGILDFVLDDPGKLSNVNVSNNPVDVSTEEVKLPETRFPTGGIPLLVPDGSDVNITELKPISEELVTNPSLTIKEVTGILDAPGRPEEENSSVVEATEMDDRSKEFVVEVDGIGDWNTLLVVS